MRILSLFDGISGAAQALKELSIDCEYYTSEIDKWAIEISRRNHPNIIQLGDVNNVDFNQFKDIDLLVAGFPCQDLSIAKRDGKGLEGERSGLFSKCLEALEICKPKYFLFENVNSMKKEWKDKISELLGVQPTMICSSKLTAQMRKRLYWCAALQEDGSYKKIDIQQPEDKGILLKDIIENGIAPNVKSGCLTATYYKCSGLRDYFKGGRQVIAEPVRLGHFGKGGQGDRIYSVDGKSVCLSANGGGRGAKAGLCKINLPDGDYSIRKLTPIECERLQGYPDRYSESVSNSQRYKALGNSFTVPVIKHILKGML